jgi:hypothetical protein
MKALVCGMAQAIEKEEDELVALPGIEPGFED